jgi:hypothetical protein
MAFEALYALSSSGELVAVLLESVLVGYPLALRLPTLPVLPVVAGHSLAGLLLF